MNDHRTSPSAVRRRGAGRLRPAPALEADGLDGLDRDRAASLADEGGTAGAIVERQESRVPRTLSPSAVVLTTAAGVLTAILAWRLLEEMTMKKAPKTTAKPRPRPPQAPRQAPRAEPERPREDDGSRNTAELDDDCATPARPIPVPAELLEGER